MAIHVRENLEKHERANFGVQHMIKVVCVLYLVILTQIMQDIKRIEKAPVARVISLGTL